MIEHCISSYQKSQKELQYRVYITDMLKNCFDFITSGKADVPRFYDQIEKTPGKEEKPEETADDVIARITQSLTDMGN